MRRYLHGAGVDEPVLWWEGAGTGDPRWLHADERGSIVAGTNAGGASVFTNGYGPFGELGKLHTGTFGYTGQMRLPGTGLYYYKARYYSPQLGRFLETDPIGTADNQNLYGYVGNDPVNFADPTGMQAAPAPPPPPPPSIPDIVVTGSRWLYDNTLGPGTLYDRAIVVPFYSGLDLLERSGIANEGFWMAVQQAGPPPTKPIGALGRGASAGLRWVNRAYKATRGVVATRPAYTVQFGRVANQTRHTFRHVVEKGFDAGEIGAAIKSDLAGVKSLPLGQTISRSVTVSGQKFDYHVHLLPNGVANVGRITLP